MATIAGIRGKLIIKGGGLMSGEKVELICKVVKYLDLTPLSEKQWPKKLNINTEEDGGLEKLISSLSYVLRVTPAKKSKEYGFITLFTDGKGTYWFKVSRGFATALNESIASIQGIIDGYSERLSVDGKEKVGNLYGMMNSLYE